MNSSSSSKDPPSYEENTNDDVTLREQPQPGAALPDPPDAGGVLPLHYEETENESLALSFATVEKTRTVNYGHESSQNGVDVKAETSTEMNSRERDGGGVLSASARASVAHSSSELYNVLTLAKQIQADPVPASLHQGTPIVHKPPGNPIVVVSATTAAASSQSTPAAAPAIQMDDSSSRHSGGRLTSSDVPVAPQVYPQESLEEVQQMTPDNANDTSTTSTSCLKSFARNRHAQLFVALLVLLMIAGVVIGVVFGVSSNGGDGDVRASETPQPFFKQVETNIDGGIDSQHGSSVSLSSDGSRVAIAGHSTVQIFKIRNNSSDWVQMGADISGGDGNQAGSTFDRPAGNLDVVRTPVVVELSRDGATVAIGWPLYNTYEGKLLFHVGKVEVYEWASSNSWERLGDTLVGSFEKDYFGASVSLSAHGGTVAVGSPGNGGSVSMFQFNAGNWISRGDSIMGHNGKFANITSVSLSRDGYTLAVAGISDKAQSVAARTYRLKSGEWQEIGNGLEGNIGETAYLVTLSGDGSTVAISNYYISSTAAESSTANDNLDARAFRLSKDGTHWVRLGENMHAFVEGEKSGYLIALSDDGQKIVMGDPGRREGGGASTGHAHIYKYDGMEWKQLGPNIVGEAAGDQFGFSVSLSGDGNRFAAGAPFNRGEGIERGRVKVYEIIHEQ